MTKVINFYGGPGAGKSTLAAELFGYMKSKRLNVEYVSEFAKDLVWREAKAVLDDQLYVFAKQHHRMYILLNQVDYIITDSPLLLSLHYGCKAMTKFRTDDPYSDAWFNMFMNLVFYTIENYDNTHFFVDRKDRKYVQQGRYQTEDEAKQVDESIRNLLQRFVDDYHTISSLDEVIKHLSLGIRLHGETNTEVHPGSGCSDFNQGTTEKVSEYQS